MKASRTLRFAGIFGLVAVAIALGFQNCSPNFAMKSNGDIDLSSLSSKDLCELQKIELNQSAEKALTRRCSSCHSPGNAQGEFNRFDSIFDPQKMLAAGEIVAGRSSSSLVYMKAETGHPENAGLSSRELDSVRLWIDEGFAECTDGTAPAPGGGNSTLRFADVRAMLSAHSCLGCHQVASGSNGQAGLGYQSEIKKLLDFKDPANSRLILALTPMHDRYPSVVPLMSEQDRNALIEWIRSGAP